MGLRHAGSPVSAPERLSRAKQDAILLRAAINVRIVAKRSGIRYSTTLAQELDDARANLRLDDPVLDDLIARGGHRQPWQSAPDRARANPGTMGSIARKYGG